MLRQIVSFIQYALPDWSGQSLEGYSFNFDFSHVSATEDVNGYTTYSFQVLNAEDAQTLLEQIRSRFSTEPEASGMAHESGEAPSWSLPKLNWARPVYLNIFIKKIRK